MRHRSTSSPAACVAASRPSVQPRRALRRAGQPTPGVVPGPAGHGHHLVQYPALRPLVRGLERPGVPRGDLGTRRHRQPTLHALPRSPLRGHSYVRHGERFAGSFRESRRGAAGEDRARHPTVAVQTNQRIPLPGDRHGHPRRAGERLEARHRVHARVEGFIRNGKATGLARWPSAHSPSTPPGSPPPPSRSTCCAGPGCCSSTGRWPRPSRTRCVTGCCTPPPGSSPTPAN